jgi:hypothetical protein
MQTREPTRNYPAGANRSRRSPSSTESPTGYTKRSSARVTGVALVLWEGGPELARGWSGGERVRALRRQQKNDHRGSDLVNPAAVIPRVGSRCEPATGKGRRPYARAHSQALFARSAGTTSSAAARGGRLE